MTDALLLVLAAIMLVLLLIGAFAIVYGVVLTVERIYERKQRP